MSKKQVSSGAEKAEKLTKTNSAAKNSTAEKNKPVKEKKVKTASSKGKNVKKNKPVKDVSSKKAQKKEIREQKKLEAARIRAEKKQKKLEKKLDAKQKRLDRIAASKQARADRKEARRERKDMLKHETKEARIERKRSEKEAKIEARVAKRQAALEERKAKREHRLKVRAEKRAAKNDRRHAPGFGGWLAAVISLGVTTLALGTMLTFGWIYMNGVQAEMTSAHTESVYELNSVVDNLDTNLSKARVANTRNEQVKLLSEIAVESEMAETILERLPVDMTLTRNMTSFVNKMGDSAQTMLLSVANGRRLTESQIATLDYMYETNLQLKKILNEMTTKADGGDILEMIRGNENGLMYVTFGDIENTPVETPKEIHDGPFAENLEKVSPKNLEGLEEITAAKAEELAQQYFADYGVKSVDCTGEVAAEQLDLYNVTVKTENGNMWAQISKKGGKVVEFNSYKNCSDKNFSVERCIDIAEDFLDDLGFNTELGHDTLLRRHESRMDKRKRHDVQSQLRIRRRRRYSILRPRKSESLRRARHSYRNGSAELCAQPYRQKDARRQYIQSGGKNKTQCRFRHQIFETLSHSPRRQRKARLRILRNLRRKRLLYLRGRAKRPGDRDVHRYRHRSGQSSDVIKKRRRDIASSFYFTQ